MHGEQPKSSRGEDLRQQLSSSEFILQNTIMPLFFLFLLSSILWDTTLVREALFMEIVRLAEHKQS